MRLTESQSRELLAMYGAYVTEACDKCGQILGPTRFTRCGKPGEWCSRLCRDGVEHKAGVCRGCGVAVKRKRRDALYCSRTCRMRALRRQGQDSEISVNTPQQNTGLMSAGCSSLVVSGGNPQKSLGEALIAK